MKNLFLALCLAAPLAAQTITHISPSQGDGSEITFTGVLPTSTGTVTSNTYRVRAIILVNSTNAAITVTVQDKSTMCSSGPCDLVPSSPQQLSIPAASMYSMPMYNAPAVGGIQWSASASGVTGRIVVQQ